ncbi:MAG: APH(3') family aminoglycoside O-phosphotransferase [Candidatus Hodarchaeales archaeon]
MSNGIPRSIPSELRAILSNYKWVKNSIGCTKTSVFYCEQENHPSYYLKIANYEDNINLHIESEKLHWLKDKLPVPEVIHYSNDKKYEFLLISEIQGKSSHFSDREDQKKRVVALLAQGLMRIHSLDISECPFDNSLFFQIEYVKNRIKNGLINEQLFDPIRKGRTTNSIYEELMRTKPQSEDLVFTHGDYCLPNIIINNNDISGFIDFGLGGISDRYLDIGICVRSIIYNFGEKWIPYFLKEYGLSVVDNEKITFYQLLDEFY